MKGHLYKKEKERRASHVAMTGHSYETKKTSVALRDQIQRICSDSVPHLSQSFRINYFRCFFRLFNIDLQMESTWPRRPARGTWISTTYENIETQTQTHTFQQKTRLGGEKSAANSSNIGGLNSSAYTNVL